jgi:hypothetical protein
MKTPLRELHDAILKINSNDVKDAIDKLLELTNTSGKKLLQSVTCEAEYKIVKEMAFLIQSTTLYYFSRAIEKKRQTDDLSFFCCLTSTAGINTILTATFFPVLRRYSPTYHDQDEINHLQKINEYIEQQISTMIVDAMKRISGKNLQKIEQKIDKTTQTMLSLATKITPEVRNLAVSLGKKFAAGDFKQARRVYEYVRDEITYIHDPFGIEEIQPPEITMKLGAGDCDDKAVLLAALLISIGFQTCFFLADIDNDNYADHVYAGVYLPDAPELYKPFQKKLLLDGKDLHDWIPLDPTYEDSDFGVVPIVDIGILKYVPIAVQ